MKFSIVTVSFRDLDGLRETSQSVLAQTHPALEWLVLDGGSKDGTAEWLGTLSDPRLRWSSERDRGIYDAMNKGLDRATGDYVIFMNSGDAFAANDLLARTAESATAAGSPDLIYGDSIDVTEKSEPWYKKARSHLLVWRGMFAQHQAIFFRRQHVGARRYDLSYPLSGDYHFIASSLRPADGTQSRVLRLPFPVCRFELGGRSETGRIRALAQDYRIRRTVLGLSRTAAGTLWCAHLVHTVLKRSVPDFMRRLRYEGKGRGRPGAPAGESEHVESRV